MNRVALIVAGGIGRRMKSEVPKQFLPIAGIPVLYHTIKKFWNYDNSIEIIVVLPKEHIKNWKKICKDYKLTIIHKIRQGGDTRFQSVKNGLRGIKPDALVAIHDGIRPLVSKYTIKRCFDEAVKSGAAIPVLDIIESLRKVNKTDNEVVDRNLYKIVQTPQVFLAKDIKNAYKQEFNESFTDDSTVLENIGKKISLVKGNKENIKITTIADLIIAEAIYKDTQYHL